MGAALGLTLALKVTKINTSLHNLQDSWLLAVNLILLYGIAGISTGVILGILFYPFIKKKWFQGLHSPFNLYLPIILILTIFHYFRNYVLTHFIANPLMPIKGSLPANIAFTIIGLAGTVLLTIFIIRKLSGWRMGLLTVIGGVLLAVIITAWGVKANISNSSESAVIPQSAFDIRPDVRKVALIGLDGAWWTVIDSLLPQGRLPNFQRLIENGVRGDLKTLYPTYSAMIWTSVITGRLPQKHGINSFLVWEFPITGSRVPMFRLPWLAPDLLWIQENIATVAPIPSNYRACEALWNILSDNGSEVGMMNWWASWPAEPINGYNYTDHALFNKLQVLTNYHEKGGGSIHDVYPPELIPELQKFTYTPQDVTAEDMRRFINVEDDKFIEEFLAIDTYDYLDIAYEASMFKYSYPGDRTVAEAAKYLLTEKAQPDFWAIYLQGIDSMSHQYLKYFFADQHQDVLIPVNAVRYRDLVARYYEYTDELIGEFLSRMDSSTVVIIVSDHGFDQGILATGHYHHIKPDQPGESEDFHIINSHPGIFIASGPGIKSGAMVEDVTVLDITPTILHIMGYPYAQDFDGRILTDILSDSLTIDTIPTYEKGRKAGRDIESTMVDKEVRDKLKALGYVK